MPDADHTPEAGMLLVAPPTLEDPNFRRTVVLLCEHGPTGSFGLILNRPFEGMLLGDVLPELSGAPHALGIGGPVQPDTLHYLHRHPGEVPEAVAVADDVYWGGDFEDMGLLVSKGTTDTRSARFFVGYAGWGPDQLNAEVEQSGWILTSAIADVVFSNNPSDLWRTVMQRLGGEYALLSNFPDDPRMN